MAQLLPPPQTEITGPNQKTGREEVNRAAWSIWRRWFGTLHQVITDARIPASTVANLPDPAERGNITTFTSLIYVTNEAGGPVLAFSDGTNWRRVTDRAIVS